VVVVVNHQAKVVQVDPVEELPVVAEPILL
jgi:hypothetical protein